MIYQVFGNIQPPEPLQQGYGGLTGSGGGLVGFLNNLLKLIILAAGLFAVVNFILAGFGIITTSDKPEERSKAQGKIWFSILGLLIIVASFAMAALLGWIIFHDTWAILHPAIYGPG